MHFHLPTAEVFVPDGLPIEIALTRTTHLAVSAHQDDIEIMAASAILECFQQERNGSPEWPNRWAWFTAR